MKVPKFASKVQLPFIVFRQKAQVNKIQIKAKGILARIALVKEHFSNSYDLNHNVDNLNSS